MKLLPDFHCPVCGTLTTLAITPTQAFCTEAEKCRVLMFNPSLPDGGLSDPTFMNLGPDIP